VLALAWTWIARDCERRRRAQPAPPATGRPVTEAWRPAPEPYMD
jgi:hypothetical protein